MNFPLEDLTKLQQVVTFELYHSQGLYGKDSTMTLLL